MIVLVKCESDLKNKSRIGELNAKFEGEMEDNIIKKYGLTDVSNSTGWSEKDQKYYGWSHRAICGFAIGDKLFDPEWKPDDGKDTDNMNFTDRGSVEIKTKDQAKKAAENFSDYVS